MPPQPKPELPNPAAAQQHFAAAPREFHAAQAPVPAALAMTPGAISEILEPHNDRGGSAARSSARAGNPACRPGGFAIGADRCFRRRDQRYSRQRARNRQHLEFHRRRPPRRASRCDRTGQRKGHPRAAQEHRKRRRQANLDGHLQDSFAAGRRQRGRDRARHLQDGDDAARQRHPATNAGDGKFLRAAASGAVACGQRRQSRNVGAIDDPAGTRSASNRSTRRHRALPTPPPRSRSRKSAPHRYHQPMSPAPSRLRR